MSEDLIEIKNLDVILDRNKLLSNITVSIPCGSITCIVGPNGAGKSTLLRAIAALEKSASGEINFGGIKISCGLSLSLRRRIGFVMQKPYLLQGRVLDNVCYPLWVRGMSKKTRKEVGMEWLSYVGLEDLSFRPASFLSGGEAQRLALARALVFEPDLLLLDEITAHLDPANVTFIEELLIKIKSSSKPKTIVMATHNLHQAKRLATKIIFLHNGMLVEESNVIDFFNSPHNKLTKEFIAGKLLG